MDLKEPKLEVPDDQDYWNSVNNHGRLSFNEETKSEQFLDKVVKEEVPDEIEDPSLFGIVPKEELLDFQFTQCEEVVKKEIKEEETGPKKAVSVPIWKPNIQSLTDFLMDDTTDFDCDMSLGSSVLFDNLPMSSSSYEKSRRNNSKGVSPNDDYEVDYALSEDDDDYNDDQVLPDRKIMAPNKIRSSFQETFANNSHPTAIEMQQLAEKCGVRYRTVLEDFENRRKTKQIKCKKDDPCQRIKHFMAQENEQVAYTKISDELRTVLEDEIETHLLSRKRFSLGYVHVIMEKTNLAPAYIRGQYENWKRKLLTKDRDDYKIKDWKKDAAEQNNLFSIETLRQLEEAYLQKKYHCEEKEWGPKDIRSLAAHLDLEEKVVEKWINKRKAATLGLENHVIEFRREKDARVNAACGRKLPTMKVDALNAEFAINEKPDVDERCKIARRLGLTELQVRNYFNKKRIANRKRDDWEAARQEFLTLPRNKRDQLEKIASERRKPAYENMEIARRLGVSYSTLCSFIDWRKSLSAAKTNKFHF